MAKTTKLEEALGDLIAACSTLQSVLIGSIEGIERERALASFDKRVEVATAERREVFGSPREQAENPAVNPDAPISDNTQQSGFGSPGEVGNM